MTKAMSQTAAQNPASKRSRRNGFEVPASEAPRTAAGRGNAATISSQRAELTALLDGLEVKTRALLESSERLLKRVS